MDVSETKDNIKVKIDLPGSNTKSNKSTACTLVYPEYPLTKTSAFIPNVRIKTLPQALGEKIDNCVKESPNKMNVGFA